MILFLFSECGKKASFAQNAVFVLVARVPALAVKIFLTPNPGKWNMLFVGFVQDNIILNVLVEFQDSFAKLVNEERKKSVLVWLEM